LIEEFIILTQIIFIDIILAADNAIIIGLIAANFVPKNRKLNNSLGCCWSFSF